MQLLNQELQSAKTQLDASRKERASHEAALHKQITELQQQLVTADRNMSQLQQQKAEEQHSAQMQANMLQDSLAQLTTELQTMKKTAFDAKLKVSSSSFSNTDHSSPMLKLPIFV